MVTPLQQKIYEFIADYQNQHAYSPSLQEIACGVGLSPKSVSLVSRSIHALAAAGRLTFSRKGYRNIQLVQTPSLSLPLLGKIAAGTPIEAIPDQQSLDIHSLLGNGNRFVLEVKGDSMVEEGILSGDFVICEVAQQAREGDIVVALIDQQDATLKRLSYKIAGHITLIPANPTLKPKAYLPHRVQIQGVFAGLLRLKK